MIGLAIILAAVGIGDLSHGLAGAPASPRRAWFAVVLGALAATVGVLITDHTGRDSVVIVAVAIVIAAAWQLSRAALDDARAQLTSISVGLSAAVLLSTFWESGNEGIWYDFLDESEIDVFQRFSPAATAMIGAAGVALVATSNAVVRIVLRIVIEGDPPTVRIRGGRLVGPLERVLVLGLVIAGEPITAAFIVAAKSLLLYPGLREHDGVDLHVVTEYVLVGSLISWTIAFGAALLIV